MEIDRRERILPLRETADGWFVLTIPHTVVPGYDVEALRKSMPSNDFRREVMLDWQSSTGAVIYPEFSRLLHVSEDPLPYDPHRTLECGLDCPGTPAFVVTQLNAFGQWCILANLSPPEEETIGYYEFFEACAELLYRDFAAPNGLELDELRIRIVGDPAGRTPIPRPGQSPKEAKSCWDILRDGIDVPLGVDERGRAIVQHKPGWGWRCVPGPVNITDRLETVRGRLTTTLRDGLPALTIDPSCKTIIEGFAGGYRRPQRQDGRVDFDPLKDFFSHSLDATAYAASRLFRSMVEKNDDEPSKRQEFRSGASGTRQRTGW